MKKSDGYLLLVALAVLMAAAAHEGNRGSEYTLSILIILGLFLVANFGKETNDYEHHDHRHDHKEDH
jgi:hypothetical protein